MTTATLAEKQNRREILDTIAFTQLDLPSLETRGSDRLDFSDQSVWQIKAALEAAYEAGRAAAQK